MRVSQTQYLYFTVFASGMTTLAIELSASRLLGNIFGTSNLVWACIIGLILIYLTAGYFIGGRWADRYPHPHTMYVILAWGAFLSGIIPLPAGPILRLAADAFDQLHVGILGGAFTGMLILFCVPVTLLGTISPFAIRLAIRHPAEAGRVSGRIYAISTLGSFLGTFISVLLLIPTVGTYRTFLIFGALLSLVAVIGLWLSDGWRIALRWSWMPCVLVILAILGIGRAVKATQGQIYETESAYNYIQVIERDGYRYLRLNDGQGIHSIYHPTRLDYSGPWEQFLAAPFYNNPKYGIERVQSMAIIGLAAGTTARQATAVFGSIPIDGFEIDPKIIEVGRNYFGMTEPNLNAIAQDGRWGLEHSQRKYSLICIDAYRPPYIPWHLTTREFFQIVLDHLTTDGSVAINVGRAPEDRGLVNGLASTMAAVFPSIFIMDVPGTFNTIVYATAQPTTSENLVVNLSNLIEQDGIHQLLINAIKRAIVYEQLTPGLNIVYTDDLAPIEWVTNNMVLNFILFGDMEKLQ